MSDRTFVIVGGGQAGGQAAATLRREGYEDRLVLVAAEPELPYQRPPLSKDVLLGRSDPSVSQMKRPAFYEDNRIEVVLGVAATELDTSTKHLQLHGGARLRFDKLLLCTGARLRRLGFDDGSLDGVHYLRTLAEAVALRDALARSQQLVIIGGGFIGLEVAAAGVAMGVPTTLLEAGPEVLWRNVPPEVGAMVRALHESWGVVVRTGVAVRAFGGASGRIESVETDDGARIPADVVVVGVGVEPDVELAARAGIACEDGILVDELTQTNVPDVFAAGDVTNHPNATVGRRLRLESWQNAQNQAIAAARAMLGKLAQPYGGVPWFWSDQGPLNLQLLGAPRRWDRVVIRGADASTLPLTAFYLEGERIVGAAALNAPADIGPARRIMSQGIAVSDAALTDLDQPLKDLAPRVSR
jgi:3-phenylpropionate/trans-cinnamate dioxygenase ferredoxin reductase subunit